MYAIGSVIKTVSDLFMKHAHGDPPTPHHGATDSLNALAFSATTHCLTGCAIGEVMGMVAGAALNWNNAVTIAVSTVLAFAFGYALADWAWND